MDLYCASVQMQNKYDKRTEAMSFVEPKILSLVCDLFGLFSLLPFEIK